MSRKNSRGFIPIPILTLVFLLASLTVITAVTDNPVKTQVMRSFAYNRECFPAGTKILLASGDNVNIEDIKLGDRIVSQDEQGKRSVSSVNQVFQLGSDNMCDVSFVDGQHLKLTNPHPLFTPEGWKAIDVEAAEFHNPGLPIGQLRVGDRVASENGSWPQISSISCTPGDYKVYNFAVDGVHDYFAGGFLAHNKASTTGVHTPSTNTNTSSNTNSGGGGGGVHSNGPECFPAGTKILLENGKSANIEDIKVGNTVLGQDPSGKRSVNTVEEIFQFESTNMCEVTFEGSDSIQLTNPHPLFTPTGWKAIDVEAAEYHNPGLSITKLQVGDRVEKENGTWPRVTSISCQQGNYKVYNFAASGTHDYFAGGYLVHNKQSEGAVKSNTGSGAGGSGSGSGGSGGGGGIPNIKDVPPRSGGVDGVGTPKGGYSPDVIVDKSADANHAGASCGSGCVSGFYKAPNGGYYPIAHSAGGPSGSDLKYITVNLAVKAAADAAKTQADAAAKAKLDAQIAAEKTLPQARTNAACGAGMTAEGTVCRNNRTGAIVRYADIVLYNAAIGNSASSLTPNELDYVKSQCKSGSGSDCTSNTGLQQFSLSQLNTTDKALHDQAVSVNTAKQATQTQQTAQGSQGPLTKKTTTTYQKVFNGMYYDLVATDTIVTTDANGKVTDTKVNRTVLTYNTGDQIPATKVTVTNVPPPAAAATPSTKVVKTFDNGATRTYAEYSTDANGYTTVRYIPTASTTSTSVEKTDLGNITTETTIIRRTDTNQVIDAIAKQNVVVEPSTKVVKTFDDGNVRAYAEYSTDSSGHITVRSVPVTTNTTTSVEKTDQGNITTQTTIVRRTDTNQIVDTITQPTTPAQSTSQPTANTTTTTKVAKTEMSPGGTSGFLLGYDKVEMDTIVVTDANGKQVDTYVKRYLINSTSGAKTEDIIWEGVYNGLSYRGPLQQTTSFTAAPAPAKSPYDPPTFNLLDPTTYNPKTLPNGKYYNGVTCGSGGGGACGSGYCGGGFCADKSTYHPKSQFDPPAFNLFDTSTYNPSTMPNGKYYNGVTCGSGGGGVCGSGYCGGGICKDKP